MHKMEKMENQKKKIGINFCDKETAFEPGVNVSTFNLFYPCARFGVIRRGDSQSSPFPGHSVADFSSISGGEWTQNKICD